MLKKAFTKFYNVSINSLPITCLILFISIIVNAQTVKSVSSGPPFEIQVKTAKTTVVANGKDQSLIDVTIVDSHGDKVPDAKVKVTFNVKGDAKIISINNVGIDNSRINKIHTENHEWQVTLMGESHIRLMAGRSSGEISFEAKAENLRTGSTEIRAIDAK